MFQLGGVDKPNDGLCHMKRYQSSRATSDEEHIYTHSKVLVGYLLTLVG